MNELGSCLLAFEKPETGLATLQGFVRSDLIFNNSGSKISVEKFNLDVLGVKLRLMLCIFTSVDIL